MQNRNYLLKISALFILIPALMAPCAADLEFTKQLAKGVTLTQKVLNQNCEEESKRPLIVNVVTVDPNVPGVRIESVLSQDRVYNDDPPRGREVSSVMAERLDAAALINADFFPMTGDMPGLPLNLQIRKGQIISEPNPRRVIFGLTSDNEILFDTVEMEAKIILSDKWFPIRAINKQREHHRLTAFTDRFHTHTMTTDAGSEAIIEVEGIPAAIGVQKGKVVEVFSGQGNTQIPEGKFVLSGSGTAARFIDENLKPGQEVTIEFNLKPTQTAGWENVVESVGGGPWLVKDGKAFVDNETQGLNNSFRVTAHPRTAVGKTEDGKLLMVTVDGRQSISGGISLDDLAELMISLNCVDAINLDGGGSTTMATSTGVLNSPGGGIQRLISNAVAVFGDPIENDMEVEFRISVLDEPVQSGTTAQLLLLDSETGEPLDADVANLAVWSVATAGPGFVDQSGRFYGVKARAGNVAAQIGSQTAIAPVETIPGPAVRMSARLDSDETGAPNRSALTISMFDLNSNGITGRIANVNVVGGTPDIPTLVMAQGAAITGITWHEAPGEPKRVTVSSGDLPKVVLEHKSE